MNERIWRKATRPCRRALARWGVQRQVTRAVEELGELLTALSRFPKRATPEEVADEIADVMIMCRQLSMAFGDELVTQRFTAKLQRLSEDVTTSVKGVEP